jgi:hypothetical protein
VRCRRASTTCTAAVGDRIAVAPRQSTFARYVRIESSEKSRFWLSGWLFVGAAAVAEPSTSPPAHPSSWSSPRLTRCHLNALKCKRWCSTASTCSCCDTGGHNCCFSCCQVSSLLGLSLDLVQRAITCGHGSQLMPVAASCGRCNIFTPASHCVCLLSWLVYLWQGRACQHRLARLPLAQLCTIFTLASHTPLQVSSVCPQLIHLASPHDIAQAARAS